MIIRNDLKNLLLFSFLLIGFHANAQYKVKQVLIANGGSFGFNGNYITIGSYNPVLKKYALFDSVTGGDVTQIIVDSGYAYMATDSYLVKYELSGLKRVAIAKCQSLRYIAAYKDKIVATIGYDQTTTHLKIFKKTDLSLFYSENKMPDIYSNGITISGDSAYIALQGQYPDYDTIGRIAVEDLAHLKFKRVISLDTTAKGISDMFSYGNTIVGVTEYPLSRISEINLTNGGKSIIAVNSISTPFALDNDTLYAGYNDGVGGYNLVSKNTKTDIKPNPYYAAAALDTINKLFYYTGGSFSKPTKAWIYNYNNVALDSFNIGIAPEGIAIDYELKSGINEAENMHQDLKIYPNPSSNKLNISGIESHNAEVRILDLTGRIIFSQCTDLNASGSYTVPVSGLIPGIYLITVQSATGTISREFVKN